MDKDAKTAEFGKVFEMARIRVEREEAERQAIIDELAMHPDALARIESEIENFAGVVHDLEAQERFDKLVERAKWMLTKRGDVYSYGAEPASEFQAHGTVYFDTCTVPGFTGTRLKIYKEMVAMSDMVFVTAKDDHIRFLFDVTDVWKA